MERARARLHALGRDAATPRRMAYLGDAARMDGPRTARSYGFTMHLMPPGSATLTVEALDGDEQAIALHFAEAQVAECEAGLPSEREPLRGIAR